MPESFNDVSNLDVDDANNYAFSTNDIDAFLTATGSDGTKRFPNTVTTKYNMFKQPVFLVEV